MSRKKRSSMIYQISQALTEINRIGYSKKEARKENKSGIHSIKQIKETLSSAQNFGKWVRVNFGVLSLYDLDEGHYRAYLQHLTELERSAGHRQNVETALRHLEKGMFARSKRLGYKPVRFVTQARITDWRELKQAEDRSYTQEEFEIIMGHLSANVRDAILLQRYMGLRVREACHVLVRHFELKENGSYQLMIPTGEANGITKGGRYRKTPVPADFIPDLKRIISDKADSERLIQIEPSTVRKGINRACKEAGIKQDGRGTHGFRHLYCRDRLSHLLKSKDIEIAGKKLLERIMSNRDLGRKADYSILSSEDKETYKKLKEVVDTVHEEIGHGEDRWDLAERYLR